MSGTLPTWMERMLGIETGSGEGAVWSIETAWSWPPWVTLLFAAFAVAFIVAVYLRESKAASRTFRLFLAGVRLALVALAAMMIAQVSLSLHRTGLPYVAVVVDDSQSMTIDDRSEEGVRQVLAARVKAAMGDSAEPTRWNLAAALLTENDAAMLTAMAEEYKLRVYFLDGKQPRPAQATSAPEIAAEIRSADVDGETTRLGDGVRAVLNDLRGSAPAAVVLMSDGINTDGPPLSDAAELARRRGVPLFVVALGSDQPIRDLKLSNLMVDDVVFVDDVVHFKANLSATGLKGTKVRVVLRKEGDSKVLAAIEATLGDDGKTEEVRLPYRPKEVGQFKFTVEAEPQKGELNTDNNRQQRTVDVRKEKIRVLLVQAYPSFEFRYLRNMLARDETIELHTVLQDADLEYAEQDAAALAVFPVRRDELFAYDVVILGDVNPAMLSGSTLENLFEFVDDRNKGGSLVLIAGPNYMPGAFRGTPLASLMPLDLGSARFPGREQLLTEGYRVAPTELGLTTPPMQLGDTPAETESIWARLPELYWLLEIHDLKPAARVLAVDPRRTAHDGRPLPVICLQYVGAGKVLFHATDETWRWRRRVGDVFFARYWVQMIRYLSRSKLGSADRSATLVTDRRQYEQGEPVRLWVRFADERLAPAEDDGVTVVLEQRGQKTRRIPLRRAATARGTFQTTLSRLSAGEYHVWVALPTLEGQAPAADFAVKRPGGEFEQVRTDAAALRQAAETSRGQYYTFDMAERLIGDLPPGRQVPIESLPPKPLWNKWPVLLAFLTLLIGEWVLRKLGGMV